MDGGVSAEEGGGGGGEAGTTFGNGGGRGSGLVLVCGEELCGGPRGDSVLKRHVGLFSFGACDDHFKACSGHAGLKFPFSPFVLLETLLYI